MEDPNWLDTKLANILTRYRKKAEFYHQNPQPLGSIAQVNRSSTRRALIIDQILQIFLEPKARTMTMTTTTLTTTTTFSLFTVRVDPVKLALFTALPLSILITMFTVLCLLYYFLRPGVEKWLKRRKHRKALTATLAQPNECGATVEQIQNRQNACDCNFSGKTANPRHTMQVP